jgi:hypothetical protein
MDKYKFVKEKLKEVGIFVGDKDYVRDEKLLEEYKDLLTSGKDLPDGVRKEEHRRVKSNGDMYTEIRFYKTREISDEQIKAMIEVKQTKALRSIAASMKFFVGLTIVSLILGYLILTMG